MTQCDTRPAGVPNAANCDNADNWSAPVSVSPATGSYIYADVAAGPDGSVYVTWWNYSSANAIQGDSCGPAANCAVIAGWGSPQTIATLDASSGTPVPFACPTLAQPGGRAAPSPQVDVDRSGGANNGRVYVSWSDLRSASGTTTCAGSTSTPPTSTNRSWDSFVASAAGGLPGAASPSSTVGTRLLTDGEGGGQANSDDWFPWLAVDQTNGQAWADFYSTRDDSTRKTTNFYARSVTPSAASHALGVLTKVSAAPSDYSGEPCCQFGNDYGDYTGLDATAGIALPVWSDNRAGADGEAYTFIAAGASLAAAGPVLGDSAGDGDGALEPGEPFTLTQGLRNDGTAAAASVNATLSESMPDLSFSQAASAYPNIGIGATQQNLSAFAGTLAAAAPCGAPLRFNLQANSSDGPFTVPVEVPTGEPGPLQTFTGPALAIPDNGGAGSDLTVSGVGGRLSDLDVRVNISHTWDEDLTIELRAPDGTTITLVRNRGEDGDNFTNTDLDDEAATAISAGAGPFTASFRPEQPLSTMDGMDPNGVWRLIVSDDTSGDAGTLDSWRLSARGSSCLPVPAPVLTGTDPASPASDSTPLVRGTAPAGSTVRLYMGASCSGTPAATGSAADLASPGIEVGVPPGTTAQISAQAQRGAATSACSAPISYAAAAGAPPDTSVTLVLGGPAAQRALRAGGLKLVVSCGTEACRVSASGRVSVPSPKRGGRAKKIATRPGSANLGAGQRTTLTLRFSPSLRKQVARALRSRRTSSGVRATLKASAVDAAGNTTTTTKLVRIRR
jgi:subtilisin-like proprotein convertase family protein